jgi:hypothetical protein
MNQALSIALIIVALFATSLPAHAHNAPSTCNVTSRAGGKRVYVSHVDDGDELWLTIDGVTSDRIWRGTTATGSNGAISVNSAFGWTLICSG